MPLPVHNNGERINNLLNGNNNNNKEVVDQQQVLLEGGGVDQNKVVVSNPNLEVVSPELSSESSRHDRNNLSIDALAETAEQLNALGNRFGAMSSQASEGINIIRNNNRENERSIALIRRNNQELAIRLSDNTTLTINNVARAFAGTTITFVCGYFGIRLVNNAITQFINSTEVQQTPVVVSRHTIRFFGRTIFENITESITKNK